MGWKAKFHPNYSTPSESLASHRFPFRRDLLRVKSSRISTFSFLKKLQEYFQLQFSFLFFLTFARQRDSFFYPRSKRKSTFARKSRAHFRCAFNERSTRGIIKWLINKRMLIINSINWNPARYNSIE